MVLNPPNRKGPHDDIITQEWELQFSHLTGGCAYYNTIDHQNEKSVISFFFDGDVPNLKCATAYLEVAYRTKVAGMEIPTFKTPQIFYDGETKLQFTGLLRYGSVDYLLSFSQVQQTQFSLAPIEYKATAFPLPESLQPLISNRYYLQNITMEGRFHAPIVRDFKNPYVGWCCDDGIYEFKTFNTNGEQIDQVADISYVGSFMVVSTVREMENSTRFNVQTKKEIEFSSMDEQAQNLINSWLGNVAPNHLLLQNAEETRRALINKRINDEGLEPVGEWERNLFETSFEGNPSLLTDDEFEMIFGISR